MNGWIGLQVGTATLGEHSCGAVGDRPGPTGCESQRCVSVGSPSDAAHGMGVSNRWGNAPEALSTVPG